MAGRGERGVSRVLEKLEASVNSGQYYEAHQMYRTLYFRYLGQEKYTELLNLLHKGATILLQHDQQGSGADLAILLIDVLNKSETKVCPEWIEKIGVLFENMSSSIPERDVFLTNAVKWSMNNDKKGHPLLHKKIAEVYWKEKKYSIAHRHFLHSNDGAAYATMLIELHTAKGLKSEIDMFITQAVLQCLCLNNKEMATEAFNKYTGSHPTIKNHKGPPYIFPLLNFIWLLLKAIEEKHILQFKILRTNYALSIRRDPNYVTYLDTIGRVCFGVKPPKKDGNMSMFQNILNKIMREDDDKTKVVPNCSSAPDLD